MRKRDTNPYPERGHTIGPDPVSGASERCLVIEALDWLWFGLPRFTQATRA